MEYAGGAAGAALGFIHGNIPGARLGYELGRYAARRRNFLSQNSGNDMPRDRKSTRLNSSHRI